MRAAAKTAKFIFVRTCPFGMGFNCSHQEWIEAHQAWKAIILQPSLGGPHFIYYIWRRSLAEREGHKRNCGWGLGTSHGGETSKGSAFRARNSKRFVYTLFPLSKTFSKRSYRDKVLFRRSRFYCRFRVCCQLNLSKNMFSVRFKVKFLRHDHISWAFTDHSIWSLLFGST